MANFKIVIADADTVFDKDITPDIFEKFGELEVWGLSSHEEIMERAKDADAILCNKTVIDREVIDAAPKLKYIGLCTDICVVSNALILKANFPQNKISVDPECCAGVTRESHLAALNTMKMCQIAVAE